MSDNAFERAMQGAELNKSEWQLGEARHREAWERTLARLERAFLGRFRQAGYGVIPDERTTHDGASSAYSVTISKGPDSTDYPSKYRNNVDTASSLTLSFVSDGVFRAYGHIREYGQPNEFLRKNERDLEIDEEKAIEVAGRFFQLTGQSGTWVEWSRNKKSHEDWEAIVSEREKLDSAKKSRRLYKIQKEKMERSLFFYEVKKVVGVIILLYILYIFI